jgi:hypothetical protein
MASNLFVSDRAVSTMLFNLGAQLNGGFLQIWAGAQPANANTATSASNTILSECAFSSLALTSYSANSAFAGTLTATTAVATSTAIWYSAVTSSNKNNRIIDGSVGLSSADLILNSTSFASGVSVSVTSYVIIFTEH